MTCGIAGTEISMFTNHNRIQKDVIWNCAGINIGVWFGALCKTIKPL